MKNIYDVYMERVNYINSNEIARFNGEELNHLWFTSDNHFGRDKTRVLTCRPFDSANEMDKAMIRNWNRYIKPDDIEKSIRNQYFDITWSSVEGVYCESVSYSSVIGCFRLYTSNWFLAIAHSQVVILQEPSYL